MKWIPIALIIFHLTFTTVWAHSGKAKYHVIIDTDGATDDLRSIVAMLANEEVEILAFTTSNGALPAREAAIKVTALLKTFHHEGIPVGVSNQSNYKKPSFYPVVKAVAWGKDENQEDQNYPNATDLIIRELKQEDEAVVFICLGALTNLYACSQKGIDLVDELDRVIWYNEHVMPYKGFNYNLDPKAAKALFNTALKIEVIRNAGEMVWNTDMKEHLKAMQNPYADIVYNSLEHPVLAKKLMDHKLSIWDELVSVYLKKPEIFRMKDLGENKFMTEQIGDDVFDVYVEMLGFEGIRDNRVFASFPVQHDMFMDDVSKVMDDIIAKHGLKEWRVGVITNELHGHLGIYAMIGAKMGLRVRDYFRIGVDDIRITSYAGSKPPVSCMNDGLQVSTGGTLGHGLIEIKLLDKPLPQADFEFKNKQVRLNLKDAYRAQVRKDIAKAIEDHGLGTKSYWQSVRVLALKYWLEWDRNEIFDIIVIETPDQLDSD